MFCRIPLHAAKQFLRIGPPEAVYWLMCVTHFSYSVRKLGLLGVTGVSGPPYVISYSVGKLCLPEIPGPPCEIVGINFGLARKPSFLTHFVLMYFVLICE